MFIKFKDRIHTSDEAFNLLLKGRYAYWIRMKYVIPLEDLSLTDYIQAEREGIDENLMVYTNIWKSDDLCDFIDYPETEKANSTRNYEKYNQHQGNLAPHLTQDSIKNAYIFFLDTILQGLKDASSDGKVSPLLERAIQFFKNKGNDDILTVLYQLQILPDLPSSSTQISSSTCGCSNPYGDLNIPNSLKSYNLINIYTEGLKNVLLRAIQNPDFWIMSLEEQTTLEVKEYVDSMIRLDLDITGTNFKKDAKDFSQALEYIAEQNLVGHKNFIRDSIFKFVKYIPQLYWV